MIEKERLMVWLREHMETKPLRLTELMAERLLSYADQIDTLRVLDRAQTRLTETVKERVADPQLVEVDLDDLPPVGEGQSDG